MNKKLFSDEEYQELIMRFVTQFANGVPEESIYKFVAWCETTMLDFTILGLFLKGMVRMEWNPVKNDWDLERTDGQTEEISIKDIAGEGARFLNFSGTEGI